MENFIEKMNFKRFELIKRYIKGETILDFGGGQGELHKYLETTLRKNILCIDELKNDKVDIRHDFNKFPYPFQSNYADCIIAGELIEHLECPALFLKECRRILKIEGHLILTTPNMTGLQYLLSNWKNNDYAQHLHGWNMELFKSLIKRAGLKVIKTELITAYWHRNLLFKFICKEIPNLRTNLFVVCKK